MIALVTGGSGFVAGYLAKELEYANWNVVLSDVVKRQSSDLKIVDLTDPSAVSGLISEVKPDAVFHLGAVSFVPDAARNVELMERVNVGGTKNLIESILREVPNSRFLFVSTALVLNEPISEYAESKLKAEKIVQEYVRRGLNAVIARPANHTGPGQSPKFVVPSFVKQANEIKTGERGGFTVGNLDAVRDFTDVRDVVRAYRILVDKGECGEVYNICSDCRMSIRKLLEKVSRIAGVDPIFEIDESLWRPTDETKVIDTSEIKQLGWGPEISIEQTIADMIYAG